MDTQKFIDEQTAEIRGKVGDKKAIVALSGGVDSSVCAALIVKALGRNKCLGIIIPAPDSDPRDATDAGKIAEKLGINTIFHPLDILDDFKFNDVDFEKEVRPLILTMDTLLPPQIELPYIMKLRGRMYIVTYYARKNNYFQCETLEKTEWLLGWHDKFGDGVGDIAPIRHLFKSKVYAIAKELVTKGMLPNLVLDRTPGSGNYPLNDFEELGGLSIQETDDILAYRHLPTKTIEAITGINPNKIAKIKHLVNISRPKRKVPFMMQEQE